MEMDAYDPEFARRSPAFSQLSPALMSHLASLHDWPAVTDYERLGELCTTPNAPELPKFAAVSPMVVKRAGGYEHFIAQHGIVPTRPGNWHDLFNALIWFHYPRFKWAANALQIAECGSSEVDPRNKRTPVQSRAAQFDEGGVVVLVDDLRRLEPLEHFDWHTFFVTQRESFTEQIRCLVVGHALLEYLLQPFMGITAKALALEWSAGQFLFANHERQSVDQQLAEQLPAALRANHFHPLPVLGIPGWHAQQTADFYADPRYFRRRRTLASPG
ncbi:MAG TPA: DUF3025 domain-containing protein [Polyangiaceae bacterium]|jgi:hypothetical protein|nr:DUF3025 domain-containing protein [Polyangiaceae bacterium]